MEVELDADHRLRPHTVADAAQQVALAVVAALRHHGAVEMQQHEIDRAGRREVVEHGIAELRPDGARRRPGRLGEGRQAFRDRVAAPLRLLAPHPHRLGEI